MSVFVEYIRYQKSIALVKQLSVGLSEKSKYELRNILERWLLAEWNSQIDRDTQFQIELLQKRICTLQNVKEYIEKAKLILSSALTEEKGKVTVLFNSIVYLEYFTPLTPRIRFLLTKGTSDQIMSMLLRYESILPGGQHWGVPWPVSDYLYILGFRNEGFSSPLNSRFIDKPETKFCTLFYDTDSPFGSIGSFFFQSLDISSDWMINPPMIASLLDPICDKIEDLLNRTQGQTRIFFSMSAWTDTPIFKRLSESKHLIARVMLEPNQYYYHTPLQDKIIAPFRSVYFVLGRPLQPTELHTLEKLWKP